MRSIATTKSYPAPVLMRPPGGVLQRKCACGQHATGGECEECGKKKRELQRKKGRGSEPSGVPALVFDVLNSPGQPLDPATRNFMESRFISDFSGVRLHDDGCASQSAKAVNAHAYTVGSHVVFGQGRYQPHTSEGRRLLAHELTHVVQQRSVPRPQPLTIAPGRDHAEREAEVSANRVLREPTLRHVSVLPGAGRTIQRQGTFGGFFSSIARTIFGVDFSETDIRLYLKSLETNKRIEDDFDSDLKARQVVRQRQTFEPLDEKIKALLVLEMLEGATPTGDEDAIIELFRNSSPEERRGMVRSVGRDRLWEDFSYQNRRIIEALTLDPAEFSDPGLIDRLRELSASDLQDYRDNAVDPKVKAEIEKLIHFKNISTPVGPEAKLGPGGSAVLEINGFEVAVLPDIRDPKATSAGETGVINLEAPAPGGTLTNGRLSSIAPIPKIKVEIRTRYQPTADPELPSAYGRGTTPADIQAGKTSLRFHEGQHGLDQIEFLKNNPAPQFKGKIGDTEEQFLQAQKDYNEEMKAYFQRLHGFSVRRTDCPGKPVSVEGLKVMKLSATFCTEPAR